MSTLNTLFSSGYNKIKNILANGSVTITDASATLYTSNLDCSSATYIAKDDLKFYTSGGSYNRPIYFTSGTTYNCSASIFNAGSVDSTDNGETLSYKFAGKVNNTTTNTSWWSLTSGTWYQNNFILKTDKTESYHLLDNYPKVPQTLVTKTISNVDRQYVSGSSTSDTTSGLYSKQLASKIDHYTIPSDNNSYKWKAQNKVLYSTPVHLKLAWDVALESENSSTQTMFMFVDTGDTTDSKEISSGLFNTLYVDFDSLCATDNLSRDCTCTVTKDFYVPFSNNYNFYVFTIANYTLYTLKLNCNFYIKSESSYSYTNVGKPYINGNQSVIEFERNSARTFVLGSNKKLYCVS